MMGASNYIHCQICQRQRPDEPIRNGWRSSTNDAAFLPAHDLKLERDRGERAFKNLHFSILVPFGRSGLRNPDLRVGALASRIYGRSKDALADALNVCHSV
jgi:hypothetical protein